MLKTRLLAAAAAFAVGFTPMIAAAAPVTVPVVRSPSGQPIQATPVITVDTTGAYVAGGGSSGGGDASAANQTSQITLETAISNAVTAMSAKLPATLGIKTSANSLSITPGSDAVFAVTGTFWQATQPISAAALPLPSGAATAAGLTTINTTLGTPYQAGGALPLPSGAATSAKQDTLVTALGSPYQAGGALPLPSGAATAARQASLDSVGAQIVPKAGTSDRVVTKTALSANTSTQICPTAASPVTTEIWVETGAVGISLSGGTLTQATFGTTANTKPDLVIVTAGTLYVLPVAATNAFTAYTATAQGTTCIQTLRQ